jgi:hypothetical protein
MSACRSVGSRPEVDEPISASAGAWRSISASSFCFSSSRSGALSWMKSAPSTASSRLLAKRSAPAAPRGALVKREKARSASARTSPIFRSASGSGSETVTSTPFWTSRAAQPPPMTPPPTTAALRTRRSRRSHSSPPRGKAESERSEEPGEGESRKGPGTPPHPLGFRRVGPSPWGRGTAPHP